MARDEDRLTTDEKIERRVGRTIVNGTLVAVLLLMLGAWVYRGSFYTVEPGEGAVVLRVGEYNRTVTTPGLHFSLPPPFEQVTKLELGTIRRQTFGVGGSADTEQGGSSRDSEDVIQTGDSNIVNMSYEVQYTVRDAYSFRFGMRQPDLLLRDATQAAVRTVIGSRTVDQVLNERERIMFDARKVLDEMLTQYFVQMGRESAFEISSLTLLNVQPPAEARQAFDDVASAKQDLDRLLSEAKGDEQEILQQANAQAVELRESALAYKQEKVLESQGESARFESLLVEYQRAPAVTRERLYLETMEQVLPDVDKVLVEPDTAAMMPFYPLGATAGAGTARRNAPRPAQSGSPKAAAPKKEAPKEATP